jgi:hypothetical protein
MKTLEKEESQLKEKTNNLQKQVIGEMKK